MSVCMCVRVLCMCVCVCVYGAMYQSIQWLRPAGGSVRWVTSQLSGYAYERAGN